MANQLSVNLSHVVVLHQLVTSIPLQELTTSNFSSKLLNFEFYKKIHLVQRRSWGSYVLTK
jgi:hypothetical protein